MIQYNYITSEFSYNHFKNVGYLKHKAEGTFKLGRDGLSFIITTNKVLLN